jgi:hypothetical protein
MPRLTALKRRRNFVSTCRAHITEAREAVQGLRSATLVSNDLAGSIGLCGEELAREQGASNPTGFHEFERRRRRIAQNVPGFNEVARDHGRN